MRAWKFYAQNALDHIAQQDYQNAQLIIHEGLDKIANHPKLQLIANDVYRGSGDLVRALAYAQALIAHHPDNWSGYGRASEDLLALEQYHDARATIHKGLEKFPNHVKLLCIANDVYRASGDVRAALSFAQRITDHHPTKWDGYIRKVLDQLVLGEDILIIVEQLMNCPRASFPGHYSTLVDSLKKYSSNDSFDQLWSRSFRLQRERAYAPIPFFQPYQYWSQGNPPDDVIRITEKWNSLFTVLGLPRIILFDSASAQEWIDEFCPDLSVAFSTAFHYTVESDIFRMAYACFSDCIWIDADLYPTGHTLEELRALLPRCDTILGYLWRMPRLNCEFFVTKRQSPFFARMVSDLKNYTFVGKAHTVREIFSSFGPARYNLTLKKLLKVSQERLPQADLSTNLSLAIDGWTYGFVNSHTHYSSRPPFVLSYKSTVGSWQVATGRVRTVDDIPQ